MGTNYFQLRFNTGNTITHRIFSLKSIWIEIKNHISLPSNWTVIEIKDSKIIDSISAYYLIENYKESIELPHSLSDIKNPYKKNVLICNHCKRFMYAPMSRCQYCQSQTLSTTDSRNADHIINQK